MYSFKILFHPYLTLISIIMNEPQDDTLRVINLSSASISPMAKQPEHDKNIPHFEATVHTEAEAATYLSPSNPISIDKGKKHWFEYSESDWAR